MKSAARAMPGDAEHASANPLEWWAGADADGGDVGFGASSIISIDSTMTGPLLVPDLMPIVTSPVRAVRVPAQAQGSVTKTKGAGSVSSGSNSMRESEDALDPWAPLEFDSTSYVPAWRVSTARIPAIVARAETMVAIIQRLMRSSGLYAVAALGAPAVSLALTPYLAHYLSSHDYGLLAVLNTSISLFAGLTQLGLGSAFFRAYNYDYTSPQGRRSVLATSLLLMTALSGAFLAVAWPLAPFLAGLLVSGGGSAATSDVRIACLVIASVNLSVPAFAWLRAEERPLWYSLASMLNVLVTLGASLWLVGALGEGVAGAMIANGAGYVAVIVCAFIPMLVASRLRVSAHVARSMLAFGTPMTLSVISVWVLQLSDRYLLAYMGDYSQTASYSVAYSLGSVLSTIVLSPFSLAWPTAMYSIAKRSDAPRVFQHVFRWFTAVLLLAAFGLSLGSTVLLDFLFPPSYHAAAPVIPVIAASIALYGVYTVVMAGANLKRKTWMASVFTATAALVNVGLNLVLIPRFGSMGAAYSTFFAYLTLVVVAYIANQRIYPVHYEVFRAVFAGLMGVALFYLLTAGPDVVRQQYGWQLLALAPGRWTDVALAVLGLLIYSVWLFFLLRIRTIDFRVSPVMLQRMLGVSRPRAQRRPAPGEAYAPR
jgi:O-antigen/teichoic acid export membrane protein